MKIEFDPAKSERNARERGLSFDLVSDFDFEGAQIVRTTDGIMAKFDIGRSAD